MKKILLGITCFFVSILSIDAQVLFGTTYDGNTINKFNTVTNELTAIKPFIGDGAGPNGDLTQASNGKLYGLTAGGGINTVGVIFSFELSTSTYTKLYDFDTANGSNPYGSLIQAKDGKLYGLTYAGGLYNAGVIFSFDPLTAVYTKLKDFDKTGGGNPTGTLMQASDGKLYGTAGGGSNGYGVIFSFDPSFSIYTTLYDFDKINGSNPNGTLIQAKDGKLYGVAQGVGRCSGVVIFSFDPSTSIYSKLMDNSSSTCGDNYIPYLIHGSLIQANDGKLYGMTYEGGGSIDGTIFSFDPSTYAYVKLKNLDEIGGSSPNGSLMQASDGKLYGMTTHGGKSGLIFSFDPLASKLTLLREFGNGTDGNEPNGSLIQANDGKLYGMTSSGGTGSGFGVIFSYDPTASIYTKLKDFGYPYGLNPNGNLLQAKDGKLYSTTNGGGSKGFGVIFSFDPYTSAFAKLKDFDNIDGASPFSNNLIQANDGKLYGMTSLGGASSVQNLPGNGVIFSFDPSTSIYTKLKDFDNTSGYYPYGGLIQATNGKLYGATSVGGNYDAGVIFSFDPASSIYTKLVDFDGPNGAKPLGSLIQARDGKLYGTTAVGGNNGYGVIFSFDPSSSTYTKLKDFDNINGSNPTGSLIQAKDGKLYGLTSWGGDSAVEGFVGFGVIFSFDPSSSIYTKLKDFDGTDGGSPIGNLMQASDSKLYGVTSQGGKSDDGIIFSYDPSSSIFTKLKDFDGTNGAYPTSGFIEIKECRADTSYYRDADGDGYGNPDSLIKACTRPAGYVRNNTDCDDTKASVHPGAEEICGNGIDDNCNGEVDENCSIEPFVTINDVSVKESQRVAILTVTLSHVSSKPVWLLYYTKDGTAVSRGRHKDYQAKFGLLAIRPGSLTARIYIKVIKDRIAEPTEYFDVILFRSLHADITDSSGRVYISDGTQVTNSKTDMRNAEMASASSLELKVMPNPTAFEFNLTAQSNETGKINIRVVDVQGQLIEARGNINPGQTFRVGSNYRPGTYFIQALQGEQRKTITVIKLSN